MSNAMIVIDTEGVDGPEIRWFGLGKVWRIHYMEWARESTGPADVCGSRPGPLRGVNVHLCGGPSLWVEPDDDGILLTLCSPLLALHKGAE